MDELKPCPFCGGKASIGKTIDGMNWQIVCRGECRCTSAYFAQKENAVAAWNRRPATENKPLICCGCAYEPYAPSEEHCFGCARMYGDHYTRKPGQEEK